MISLDSVTRVYDEGVVIAVNNVSLDIESGEKLALKGPSGAGKSTLLNLIGTIDSPTSGEIHVNGENLVNINRNNRFRAKTIGFIFQFHHLLPGLTALENVELPLFTEKMTRRDRRDRAMGLLESVGIEVKNNKLPGQLSGGERQRIAVARALVNNPSIILADEPTGSLDAETGKRVIDLLIDYCRLNQATLILATHNNAIAEYMDRSIFMEYGRIN
jgi:ABC-type lipoprotein export system ATPase subunit